MKGRAEEYANCVDSTIQLNKIYESDCVELMQKIPDKSIKLAIIDPPYFQVKGEFDFQQSFTEWQILHQNLVLGLKRILADNGSILLYGHAKNIAYQQIIFDQYFKLENSLVWEKKECQTRRWNFKESRIFAPVTERILFYSIESQLKTDIEARNASVYFEEFEPIRLYLRREIYKIGIKKVAKTLNISERGVSHWISKSQWAMIPESRVKQLQKQHPIFEAEEYDKMKSEYQKANNNYHKFPKSRRYFDNKHKFTDVLLFSQESHITKKYNHPTQKPPKLTNALITTTTQKDDVIFIPFAGSGVECEQAIKEGRNFIACDTNPNYCRLSSKRVENERSQLKIF